MDDTHANGLLDATTSRKRRSSILKSQRPPRTPLTELELNVATPPDNTKSRRVSFSRRTGVAEFITDEATNAWKTMYVEQNKSLESSLNDSAKNPPKQTVGHLGKRVFEQQFQEQIFNFESKTSDNRVAQELNMSLGGNLTQQFAALERDFNEKNFAPPQTNFELSSLTDHKSKIFVDDVTNPTLGEVSNQININFSSVEAVGAQDKCYDLDEIEKDLMKPRNNVNRLFSTMTSVSEQIEIDLNIKSVGLHSEELDMSITDTVRNPQVEEVVPNYKRTNDRTSNMDDWTLDKENIVVNPYVAPKESINFAINEIPDQVLVFDGRRLTVQSGHTTPLERNREEKVFNNTLLHDDISDRPQQRKTIVLNLNDDLPNFIDVPAAAGVAAAGKHISTSNEKRQTSEMDFPTHNLISNKTDISNLQKTVIYDSCDVTNISVTQAIITNILLEKEKRKTIVFGDDTGDLSMTQALPSNVLAASKCVSQNKTVLYDVDNISITQAVPLNILLHNKSVANSKSVASSQSDFDLSFTQAVPHNVFISNKSSESNKRNTIVFDNDKADISITRVLPSNILVSDNNRNDQKADVRNLSEIVRATFDKENVANKDDPTCDKQSNKTLLEIKESKDCNRSETKMISLNILANTEGEMTQLKQSDRRLSYKSDQFITNMSITESVPNDILLLNNPVTEESTCDDVNDCDISVTQTLPSNIILEQRDKISRQESAEEMPNAINSRNDINNITTVEEISRKSLCQLSEKQLNATVKDSIDELPQDFSEGFVRGEHSKSYADMSITQVSKPGEVLRKSNHKRGTIVFENDEMGDISVTRAIPTNIMLNEIKCNRDNTLLLFENVNIDPFSSVSASEGMLTKSEENVSTKLNTSYAVIPPLTETTLNIEYEFADNCQIYTKSIASRTLQQAKEELQKSLEESNNVNKDMSIDNIYHDHAKPLSDHDETLLQSMNYVDCVDQKIETHSLKSATEHKNKDVFVYQAVTTHNVSKHQGLRTEQGDVKSERAIKKYEEITLKKSNAGKESEVSLLIRDVSHYTDERKTEESPPTKQKGNTSILVALLNMSGESLNMSVDGMDDKNVMVDLESVLALEKFDLDCATDKLKVDPAKSVECTLEETMDTSALTEDVSEKSSSADGKEVRSCNIQAENIHRPPLSLSYEQENDQQEIVEQESDQQNKDKSVSSHSDKRSEANSKEDFENKNGNSEEKYFKEADDTKELLEILTDFTDKTMPGQPELDSSKSSKEMIDVPIDMEDKTDVESKDNCDKAQNDAQLAQPSQEAMEGIESEDFYSNDGTGEDTDEAMYKEANLRRKSGHVSREVVKTLQFDESNDEIKCNSNSTPLKKTTPVDISESKDSKAKVIPMFMNDVDDGLKSLMEDLVKPTADLMPFHKPGITRLNRKSTTTANKELQTNIITSSQIDITDINSCPVSESNIILARRNEDGDVALVATEVGKSVDSGADHRVDSGQKNHRTKQVLLFDHKNPLNNVILCPSGKTDIHRYSPKSPDSKDLETSPRMSTLEETIKEAMDTQRVSTQYNMETNSATLDLDKQLDGLRRKKKPFDQIDGSDVLLGMVWDPVTTTEVNTVIAMKCNKQLLQASSSLTLLDDEVNNVIINKPPIESTKTSPVRVIFKLNDPEHDNVESSYELSDVESSRAQNRNYQRAKHEQYRARTADTTPKPLHKMPKLSSSPRHVQNCRVEPGKPSKPFKSEPPRRCANPNKTKPKVRTTTIVQHFTVCKLNAEDKEKLLHHPLDDDVALDTSSGSTLKTETISRKDLKECTSREMTSFTSSNAMKEMEYMPSLMRVASSQETLHTDTDDCSDLGSQIESLSFLGRECECEGCEPDAWCFLLLRRRLRLTVRVARDLADPPPAPDTPAVSITIEPLHKESEAVSCAAVRLACEAMRYECVRCGAGRGVSALLRRCVGVSRAAARWARHMADARAHLAFTLAHCGKILLTVANFHVRRVWQVTLRVELVVEDARELAWPRASHVLVREVTPGAGAAAAGDEGPPHPPHSHDLHRVLARVPHDWGHVPRTIWKVFRYLKNKTEDELYWPPQSR